MPPLSEPGAVAEHATYHDEGVLVQYIPRLIVIQSLPTDTVHPNKTEKQKTTLLRHFVSPPSPPFLLPSPLSHFFSPPAKGDSSCLIRTAHLRQGSLHPLRAHLLEPIHAHDKRAPALRQTAQVLQITNHFLERHPGHNLPHLRARDGRRVDGLVRARKRVRGSVDASRIDKLVRLGRRRRK